MNTSSSIAHIAPALIKAQATIGAASKDAKNPFYSSTYADLGSVMAVCKEPLLAQGISILQPLNTRENGDIILITLLLHESGEFIASEMKITPPKRMVCPKSDKEKFDPYLSPDPQAEGSAITYARRYSLQSLVGIPSVDDDAEWAERALSRRPVAPDADEQAKIGAEIDRLIGLSEAAKTESERLKYHEQAMMLEKSLARRIPEPTVNGVPATAVETVVLPPETPANQPKATRTRKSTPAPADATPESASELPWREVVCHIGQRPGAMADHTLEQIFVTGKFSATDEVKLGKLVDWFKIQSLPTSSKPNDQALWKAVQAAEVEMRAGFTQPTEKPAQEPAAATGWRAFTIPGRSPDWSGEILGNLTPEEVKQCSDEYVSLIEMARATAPQKMLKAQVALAMAELFPKSETQDLPLAEGFDHVKALNDLITQNKWDAGFFVQTAKMNGWVSEGCRKVADISPAEYDTIESKWDSVETEMAKAHQPAQQP